jgi:hypothetical protein
VSKVQLQVKEGFIKVYRKVSAGLQRIESYAGQQWREFLR